MYMYNRFTLLYNRSQHNIVNQLYSNKNFFKTCKFYTMCFTTTKKKSYRATTHHPWELLGGLPYQTLSR